MPPLRVKDLRCLLSDEDIKEDWIIVLAKDAEENEFSPVPGADPDGAGFYTLGHYEPDTTWYGDFYSGEDLDDDRPINALVLWPTN